MDKALLNRLLILAALTFWPAAIEISGQSTESPPKKVNFDYSQNPKTKTKSAPAEENKADGKSDVASDELDGFDSRSLASNTLEAAKKAGRDAVSPTEIYKVGVGDVLFISLQNAPAGGSSYFTVLNDGAIDYPIAGGTVEVQGLTTDAIEELLQERIKLIDSPRVTVRVRDHASHTITVLGLVERPGEKNLQREAVPLFVVRAEAIVKPEANRVAVRSAGGEIETFELGGSFNENMLIFPGDIVEFSHFEAKETASGAPQFFYIGGDVKIAGQKDFYQGLTLTQAILASGGLTKPKTKSVVIRRKNSAGLLEPAAYNLNLIKSGKIPDPLIEAGDTIEVGN